MDKLTENIDNLPLFDDIKLLIEQSQRQIATQTNSILTQLFWEIGRRINDEVLQNRRANYGKQIVPILAAHLTARYGRNFEEKNLRRMLQFASQFPDWSIVGPLARQLTWSHFLILIPLKTTEKRMFYAHKCMEEMWGKRDLRRQIALNAKVLHLWSDKNV